MAKHKEVHFEDAVEEGLLAHGWAKGNREAFDPKLAIDVSQVIAFIKDSQPQLWADLVNLRGKELEKEIVVDLVKNVDDFGTLHVLRNGFKFYGKLVRMASFRPSHGLTPELLETYKKNRLVVTRQVPIDPADRAAGKKEKTVDTVLLLNGLPIVTVELKNPLTDQDVNDAITQYRRRDPHLPLFRKRALVHFAVDPDLAYMTTKLQDADTTFLPFNRGDNNGAGNPPDENGGHRTAYLWEQVWARDSFLDIVARFIHVATEEKQVAGEVVKKETVIFPRYHQLDAVRLLEGAARKEGPGNNYLVQHSAGSGKSNSIAWLAYRLSELHRDDKKVFDSIVVVTDRLVLDKQLQDTIYQFEHKKGVVERIEEDSNQLAKALTAGTPIIITTLQKFPFVAAKIGELPNRNYAVIVDEAHSSQGGESAAKMKEILRAKDLEAAAAEEGGAEGEEDEEDRLRKVMESRGPQKNLSFFAFTATPKAKTLEVFGRRDEEGKPRPFHLYSMRQAIEEGFILDVLQNYTTYKTYWHLAKATAEDRKVPKRETAAQLARFVSLHPHNVAQKTEIVIEHFRSRVKHKIGGKAKAMLVTSSRLHAVRYERAFKKYIKEKGYGDVRVLVAFSGQVEDPDIMGEVFTEPGLNGGIKEAELPARFATDEFNVLIVANKYQTGFDQPLLHTMYVDKRLAGVQAVQTLSRLNRIAAGKEDTFVLDFVNETEDIRKSFQPYYEQTIVAETADPHRLYELQHDLDGTHVYTDEEVKKFCDVFYKPIKKQTVADHAEMYKALNPAVDRFKALDADTQDMFRTALTAYVRLYSFLSQVMPFADPDLERLYTYGRFLELKLPQDPRKAPLKVSDEAVLTHYRIEKIEEGRIALKAGEQVAIYGPTEAGSPRSEVEEVKLSEVIDVLNERFGTHFTKSDQVSFFDGIIEEAKADEEVKKRAVANTFDNFSSGWLKKKISDAVIDRMSKNGEIATRYLNDPEFENVAFEAVVKRIYQELRRGISEVGTANP